MALFVNLRPLKKILKPWRKFSRGSAIPILREQNWKHLSKKCPFFGSFYLHPTTIGRGMHSKKMNNCKITTYTYRPKGVLPY